MRTLRTLRSSAALWLLAASIPAVAGGADPKLGLAQAARQALEANLDLAARRRALAADREQIGIARSTLLPQVNLGSRAQILEDHRADGTTKESILVAAGVTQVIYDETNWADFQIQKHTHDEQTAQFESFRLGVVEDTANTFLALNRARAHLDIQQRNRDLTARNLETSRARIAAGWSSEREVLRWQSQLASNDTDVVAARTQVIVSTFELNRVRNRSAEEPIAAIPAGVEEYGFVYARKRIADAIAQPEGDRRLRDLLVRVGLGRSPELAATDAAIGAAERQLAANQRAFWVPSLSVGAAVDHLAYVDSGSSDVDFDDTEWTVAADLTFPLIAGGAKFIQLHQTREILSSLRIQRRSTAQSIDQGIRAALAAASGTYENLAFTRRQEAAALRNFELVNESYVLGMASILGLLDAQAQLLSANQAVADSNYDFLEALIGAEKQIALYPFLEPESEMTELLDRIEQQLWVQP
ncbi:MAG: TolC family protein [Deltaproteobacteria bacterium]|nr:TolC family protein [Deltaproteobacteria bacterium]